MPNRSAISVENLDEARRALRRVEKQAQNELKKSYKNAGDIIVAGSRPAIPVDTGRLAKSLKSQPTLREGRVKLGTPKRAAYAGWVEFGGRIVFPRRAVVARRPFVPDGRFFYPRAVDRLSDVRGFLVDEIEKLLRRYDLLG